MPEHAETTAILIGTPRGIASLHCQLAFLAQESEPIWACGCVVLGNEPMTEAGVPVLGPLEQLQDFADWHNAEMILACLPRTMSAERDRVVHAARSCGLKLRFVPPIEDFIAQPEPERAAPTREEIDVASLIGREPRAIDENRVAGVLRGRRVLITGSGGSIGSELARLAASFDPAELVLVERSENALFEIDRELRERFPGVNRRAVLHDVVDSERTDRLFAELSPEVVFHAAAHKHVPLMEDHPAHAVTNNFFGTKSVADASVAHGVGRFVLISSDKAVNPTSVMGATKRLAERYIQGLQPRARSTRFAMVRFGNVLGSASSVLPIWTSQLAAGRPVTVTDPRMTRYFMTIPEAASLVIQSASIQSADPQAAMVFVLDMGNPVSILSLATAFVEAHGLEPETSLVTIGARPGEKLHEELCYNAERLVPTGVDGIGAWTGEAIDPVDLEAMVSALEPARLDRPLGERGSGKVSKERVLEAIHTFVPEMRGADTRPEIRIHPSGGSIQPIQTDVAA